ncbi:unnamed protein product [Schistosoma haematobium]|nr:unnamed protein product [Schistosoma haematobium]
MNRKHFRPCQPQLRSTTHSGYVRTKKKRSSFLLQLYCRHLDEQPTFADNGHKIIKLSNHLPNGDNTLTTKC